MEHMPLIDKWKQKLSELDVQQKHLIVMDNDDEMLFQCLQEKHDLVEQIINDIKTI
jgi:hypothetical protein